MMMMIIKEIDGLGLKHSLQRKKFLSFCVARAHNMILDTKDFIPSLANL